jgi:hypothetical protein
LDIATAEAGTQGDRHHSTQRHADEATPISPPVQHSSFSQHPISARSTRQPPKSLHTDSSCDPRAIYSGSRLS